MDEHSTSTFVDAIRKEIQLIEAHELAYRTMKHRTIEQLTAHVQREIRLLEIRALLYQMRESRGAVVSPPEEKNM
jgi:hypothetical protein